METSLNKVNLGAFGSVFLALIVLQSCSLSHGKDDTITDIEHQTYYPNLEQQELLAGDLQFLAFVTQMQSGLSVVDIQKKYGITDSSLDYYVSNLTRVGLLTKSKGGKFVLSFGNRIFSQKNGKVEVLAEKSRLTGVRQMHSHIEEKVRSRTPQGDASVYGNLGGMRLTQEQSVQMVRELGKLRRKYFLKSVENKRQGNSNAKRVFYYPNVMFDFELPLYSTITNREVRNP